MSEFKFFLVVLVATGLMVRYTSCLTCPFTDIDVSSFGMCFLAADGDHFCLDTDGSTFKPILSVSKLSSISSGSTTICGLTLNGNAYCSGRLGVPRPAPSELFSSISVGSVFACGISLYNQSAICFVVSTNPTSDQVLPYLTDGPFTQVEAGTSNYACGLRPNGTLYCWGNPRYIAYAPTNMTFSTISLGLLYGCGIGLIDQKIYCWDTVALYSNTSNYLYSGLSCSSAESKCCAWTLKRTLNNYFCWTVATYDPKISGTAYTSVYADQLYDYDFVKLGSIYGCGRAAGGNTIVCFGKSELVFRGLPLISGVALEITCEAKCTADYSIDSLTFPEVPPNASSLFLPSPSLQNLPSNSPNSSSSWVFSGLSGVANSDDPSISYVDAINGTVAYLQRYSSLRRCLNLTAGKTYDIDYYIAGSIPLYNITVTNTARFATNVTILSASGSVTSSFTHHSHSFKIPLSDAVIDSFTLMIGPNRQSVSGTIFISNFTITDRTELPVLSDSSSPSYISSTQQIAIALGILVPLVVIAIVTAVIFVVVRRRRVREEYSFHAEKNVDEDKPDEYVLVEEPRYKTTKSPLDFAEQSFVLSEDQIILGPRLGKGSFGEVYLGQLNRTDVAIKRIPNSMTDQVDELKDEAELMSHIPAHPNVVGFRGVILHPERMSIVMEYLKHGNLYSWLRDTANPLPSNIILQFAKDIARGMLHIHTSRQGQEIIHRDLAARNVLLREGLIAVICDFGLARLKSAAEESHHTVARALPWKWMAPESIDRHIYTKKSDVFSYGVTLFEIMTRDEPWKGITSGQATLNVSRGERMAIPEEVTATIPPVLIEVMKKCWAQNPDDRPNFSDILDILEPRMERRLTLMKEAEEGVGYDDASDVTGGYTSQNGTASGSGGKTAETDATDATVEPTSPRDNQWKD